MCRVRIVEYRIADFDVARCAHCRVAAEQLSPALQRDRVGAGMKRCVADVIVALDDLDRRRHELRGRERIGELGVGRDADRKSAGLRREGSKRAANRQNPSCDAKRGTGPRALSEVPHLVHESSASRPTPPLPRIATRRTAPKAAWTDRRAAKMASN